MESALSAAVRELATVTAFVVLAVVLVGELLAYRLARACDRRRWMRAVTAVVIVAIVVQLFGMTAVLNSAWRSAWDAGVRQHPMAGHGETPRSPSPDHGVSIGSQAADTAPLVNRFTEDLMGFDFGTDLGFVWLAGSLLLAVGLIAVHSALARIRIGLVPALSVGLSAEIAESARSAGLSKSPRFGVRRGVPGPFVFGVFRPVFVLPSDELGSLRPAQRSAVLAHEMAHVAARDSRWMLISDVMTLMAWWHPAAWYLRSRLRAVQEEAADDAVMNGRTELAEALLHWQRVGTKGSCPIGATAVRSAADSLGRRIRRLLENRPAEIGTGTIKDGRRRFWARTSLLVLAVMTVMVGVTAARDSISSKGDMMNGRRMLRNSVLGLALLGAAEESARSEERKVTSPVNKAIAPAGKSEDAAAVAIGLIDEQMATWKDLRKQNEVAKAKYYAMPSGPEKTAAGAELNKWWNDSLRKMLTPDQYGRYLEYWQTNNVVIRRGKEEGKYEVSVSAHPSETDPRILNSLNLSDAQAAQVKELLATSAQTLTDMRKAVEKPAGLADFNILLAKMQFHRNASLQKILTRDQYASYRKAIDAFCVADITARRGSGPGASAPVPPKKN